MGWETTSSWDDLQFVNYGYSEELQDGRIAFWRTEDWEIYSPGAGGYTSSGPFGSVEGDLQGWVSSGSLLAPDVLLWDTGNYSTSTTRPNFGLYQSSSLVRREMMGGLLMSGNLTTLDAFALKGAAQPFNGNPNPSVGQEGIEPGTIVVTAQMRHANMSESVRYRVFDPYSSSSTDVAQSYSFLDLARRESDANVILADYSNVGGPTAELEAAYEVMKSRLQALISNLEARPSGAYFSVAYTGPNGQVVSGRILVSELLSWLRLVDFEFYSASHDFGPNAAGNTLYRNEMLLQRQDVTLQVRENSFRVWASTVDGSFWFLLHEIMHATRFGQQMFQRFGNGSELESRINTFARDIGESLGFSVHNYDPGGGGYSMDPATNYVVPS